MQATVQKRMRPVRGEFQALAARGTRRRLAGLGAAMLAAMIGVGLVIPAKAQGTRVRVAGEIVDTWCNISELMFARGTAHHQCAIWCALGGIPVSIRTADGAFYLLLRVEDDDVNAANPKVAKIASHEVVAEGEVIARDGVNYLIVSKIADDKGIITLTQDEYGIQPFGN